MTGISRRLRASGACLALAGLPAVATVAADASAGSAPRKGGFRTSFTEGDHRSALKTLADHVQKVGYRFGSAGSANYTLADEFFEIHVPRGYDPRVAHGLFVWISPGDSGSVPAGWKAVLDKHRLIYIGADKSGNNRSVYHRLGLPLDAVVNMKQLYNIDESRIYIGGFSGGGRCASMAVMLYPETFRGAFYVCGCNRPPDRMGKIVKEENRYVLLTGTGDMNLEDTRGVLQRYRDSGIDLVTYMEVPEMGHSIPSAEWFEKAVAELDKPLLEMARTAYDKALRDEQRERYGAAVAGYTDALALGTTRDFAKDAARKRDALVRKCAVLTDEAVKEFEAKRYGEAQEKAAAVLKMFGKEHAAEASELVARINSREVRREMHATRVRARQEVFETGAGAALYEAKQLLDEDLYQGYRALREVAQNWAGTPASEAATEAIKTILADPAKKELLTETHGELQARKLLTRARSLIAMENRDLARKQLEQILDQHPSAPAAKEARELLSNLRGR
ncbi:hypothetical protein ACFLSJ_04500 [Verrucomicrobiota bacterium]